MDNEEPQKGVKACLEAIAGFFGVVLLLMGLQPLKPCYVFQNDYFISVAGSLQS